MNSAIRMEGITKTFPNVVANDKIDFEVVKGEIHGLLGENGAGKTVLMSILYGLYRPNAGKIFVNGREVEIGSPANAIRLGIGMVHQHFMLVPHLTVSENIVLGKEPIKKGLLDRERISKDVRGLCEQYKLEVDLDAPIHSLPVGVQQRVEILKALYRGADVLILDEPTSVLTPQEVEALSSAIRALKSKGKTVIFISHKLREVLAICDRVTVLNGGRVVGTVKVGDVDMGELAQMMVGRAVSSVFDKEPMEGERVVLRIEDLRAANDRGLPALKGVTLDVYASEILGVAGVEGNGQTELVEAIMGLRKMTGKLLLDGADISSFTTEERMRSGISHVPEDRGKRGLIQDFSVMENLILGRHNTPQFTKWRFKLDMKEASDHADKLIESFSIKTPTRNTPARHLSGGSQQRIVVAREIVKKPKLFIASQPTRGLDIGASEYVRRKILEMRCQGCAVLLVSADLDEVFALSDRIAVMYEGKILAIRVTEATNEREIGLLMAGGEKA